MALAVEADDRAAIENVIHSLRTTNPIAPLFTANAENQWPLLQQMERSMTAVPDQPWSETAPPALVIFEIRFTDADTASVSAADLQISPVPRRIAVAFVMKREATGWRIASLRVVGSSLLGIEPGAQGVPTPQPAR
jgi:hypothetical protein